MTVPTYFPTNALELNHFPVRYLHISRSACTAHTHAIADKMDESHRKFHTIAVQMWDPRIRVAIPQQRQCNLRLKFSPRRDQFSNNLHRISTKFFTV